MSRTPIDPSSTSVDPSADIDAPASPPSSASPFPERQASSPARRRFLQSTATAAAITAVPLSSRADAGNASLPGALTSGRDSADTDIPESDARHLHRNTSDNWATGSITQPVKLNINGRAYELHLEARVTLLDALREYAGLTGTKKGCDRGQCGACTVISNGRRINACLSLAIMHDGGSITTVEGLADNHIPSALQQAFIEQDAFQCGFCTPGQLCSATAMLNEYRAGDASAVTKNVKVMRTASGGGASNTPLSEAEIRERMSGNLCRCGAYPNIVSAIRTVALSKA